MLSDANAPKLIPAVSMEIGLLVILINDRERALDTALKLSNIGYKFSVAGGKEIAEACFDFLVNTNEPPGIDQVESVLNVGSGTTAVHHLLKDIRAHITGGYFQPDFYLDQLPVHLRLFELNDKFRDLGEAIETRDADKADEILNELRKGTASQIEPMDLNDPAVLFDFLREDEPTERFHQPIPVLEEMHIHPKRGKVLSMAAAAHKGKSTYLTETVRLNLPTRKIVFISLEPGDEPEVKLMMNMFSLTKRDRKMVSVPHLSRTDEGEISVTFTEREFDSVKTNRHYLLEQVRTRWQNLRMYKIPPGTLTMERVKQIVVQLGYTGFKADMVVIDYIDKMRVSKNADHYRLEIMRIQREFSALCAECNMAGVTASQLNKEGAGKRWATMFDQDESSSKAMIGDMIMIYSQDEEEKRNKIARISVDKGRGESSGMRCVIAQNYEIGQFCTDALLLEGDQKIQLGGAAGDLPSKAETVLNLLNERRWSIDTIVEMAQSTRSYVLQISRRLCASFHQENLDRENSVPDPVPGD